MPHLLDGCDGVVLNATFAKVCDVWKTRFVGVDVMEVASLPAMEFLFRFPYILVTAFLACKAVDDVTTLTGKLMFNVKSGVGG